MKIKALEGEQLIGVPLKIENGSGWLTNRRLLLCSHESGELEGQSIASYFLKDVQKVIFENDSLNAYFKRRGKVIITLRSSKDQSWDIKRVKEHIEIFGQNFRLKDPNGPPFESRCWRMFTDFIDNEGLCPCGSGKLAYKCCIPRMPKDHIKNWYLRSQGKKIKYSMVDKFVSLWIAFISWSEFKSNGETDREIMTWLKKSSMINTIFKSLHDDQIFNITLKEIKGIPIHRYIRDEQVAIKNINDINQVLEFIYVQRCNLLHGHEDVEDDYITSRCFIILNMIFSKIMENDEELKSGRFLNLIDSYLF